MKKYKDMTEEERSGLEPLESLSKEVKAELEIPEDAVSSPQATGPEEKVEKKKVK